MKHQRVVIFGEVLFDTFPDGSKTLGGAPFNVAWHLRAFGLDPLMITRVGDDSAGHEVLAAMLDWGMDTAGIQTDRQLPTGKVVVGFHGSEPQYTIVHPAAFDAIEYQSATNAAGEEWGLLYHGSLALRSPISRGSLLRLSDSSRGITFTDVNLRPPWWRKEEVLDWVGAADWVKLNEHELHQLSESSLAGGDQAANFKSRYELAGLVLTRGERGAALLTGDQSVHRVQPKKHTRLVDSVGAGDAFTSVMLLGLVNQWPHELTLRRAQDFASNICEQRGAIVRDMEFYRQLVKDW